MSRNFKLCLSGLMSAITIVVMPCSAAETKDPCKLTSCTVTCADASGNCTVQVGLSSSAVTIIVNGTDVASSSNQCFSVKNNAQVMWIPDKATTSFAAAFNPKHSPFPNSVFLVDSSHPSYSQTATYGSAKKHCYVYSTVVCTKGGGCQHVDPKVVISSGN